MKVIIDSQENARDYLVIEPCSTELIRIGISIETGGEPQTVSILVKHAELKRVFYAPLTH